MKTYTFKIKLQFPKDKHPVILSVVHCPLEVLFDSLKEVKQFEDLFNNLKENDEHKKPVMYITASDYLINNIDDYVCNDYILCQYNSIIESKSLVELLTHSNYYGLVEDLLTTKSERDLIKEFLENEV